MIQRCLLLVAVSVFAAACSTAPDVSPGTKLVTSSPIPGGSPEAATPTAIISRLAPPPSPSPSPSPAAAASPSPVALGSPAASPVASPVAASPASPAANGPRYSVVAERSEASYHARETFVSRGFPSDAVGTTRAITGDIQLERDGVLRGQVLTISVDLRTLTSDEARRDNFIRQNTLQADQYPFAVFRSADGGGPANSHPGEEVTFQLPGVMTVHGQDRPVTWDARARLEGDLLFGSAVVKVRLSDFGIEPPRLAILSVEDEMTWAIDLVAQRQP